MAGVNDLTQSDLEASFGVEYVRNVFGDNGSGRAGDRVMVSLAVARRHADAVLMTAFSPTEIAAMVRDDLAVRSAILELAMAEGMKGRPEWAAADSERERLKKSGLDSLKLIASGERRSISETVENGSGQNPHISTGRVRGPELLFAPTRAKPVRGGY